jgi:hypothetical protein
MKIKSNGNGNGNGFPAEASPAGARGFFLVGPALAGKAAPRRKMIGVRT